jgi:hypothetical protein
MTSALAATLSVSALGTAAQAHDNIFQDIRILIKDIFIDLRDIKNDAPKPGPGPVAGVGLPFLLAAGFYAWRRRQKVIATARTSIDQQPRD